MYENKLRLVIKLFTNLIHAQYFDKTFNDARQSMFPQKSSSISSNPIKNITSEYEECVANENVFYLLFVTEIVNRRPRKAKRSRELKKCLTLSRLRNRSIIFRDELRNESGEGGN